MKAHRRAKAKVKKWEQEFQQETGKDVNEYRREFWQWLDAKGENTYGLLDKAEPAENIKVQITTFTPPVVQISLAELARALKADPRHKQPSDM